MPTRSRQSRLPFCEPVTKPKSKDPFEAANREAAEIILSDPERAAEGEALATKWARLFLAHRSAPSALRVLSGSSEEIFLSRHSEETRN